MVNLSSLIADITSTSPRGRMIRGVLANIYDKGAITGIQLLTIPLLTKFWGAEGYGVWLMLLTVPTYIALSDLGFGTAAGVIVTRCSVAQDYDTALTAIHSTIAFVLTAVLIAAGVVLGYAGWLAWQGGAVAGFGAGEIALAVVFITAYAVVVSQMSIVTIIYRGTHKFAFAMFFAGTLILMEGGALVLVITSGGGIALAGFVYFAIRTCGYFLFVHVLRKQEPWVAIGVSRATKKVIRELANPSAAALGLTLATALILQGLVLALGATAGVATVAIFGAARTLSRAPLQLSGMVLRPSLPELTRAITAGNRELERRLTRVNVAVALLVTIPFAVLLSFYGGTLLTWVSGGVLVAPKILFVVLALACVFNATWMAFAAPLISMNRQAEFSYWYLVLAVLAVGAMWLPLEGDLLKAAGLMALVEGALFALILLKKKLW